MNAVFGGLLIAGLLALYFLPMIVAFSKGADVTGSVLVLLNVFLGWSIIGWIVALSIALGLPNRQQRAEIKAEIEAAAEAGRAEDERRRADLEQRRAAGEPFGAEKAGVVVARTTRRFAAGLVRGLRSEESVR